jgi:hypothetical protein
MRMTQGTGRRPGDRIVLRTERAGLPRPAAPASRTLRPSNELRKIAANASRRDGVTMDYQMGFTSGPSS